MQDPAVIEPEPNAYSIEVEANSEAELDAITEHPAGFVELWRKGDPTPERETGHPDGVPSAAGRGKLVTGLVRLGYRGRDLAAIISPGRTRRQIADDLIELQRCAPKARR